jgi:hypothetical protein
MMTVEQEIRSRLTAGQSRHQDDRKHEKSPLEIERGHNHDPLRGYFGC